MSNAFQSASHFLGGSFAPFAGGPSRQQAPLFYSTVEEGESDGETEDATGHAWPSKERVVRNERRAVAARPSSRRPTSADSGGDGIEAEESGDEEEEHGGLGRYRDSEVESGSSSSAIEDPFRPSPRSQAAAEAAAAAQTGWRMHQTSVLPSIKQSVINDIYDHAHAGSVYTSVFLRSGSGDKGKQRESTRDDEQAQSSPDNHEKTSYPDAGLVNDVPEELRRDSSGSGLPTRQSHAEKRTPLLHHSQSMQQQSNFSGPPGGQIYRYPMPTVHYRRRASRKRATAHEPLYQDQSPRDSFWLALYLFNVVVSALLGVWQFFLDTSSHVPDNLPSGTLISPSVAILHTLPLLTGLVICALVIACSILSYLFLVKNGARHVVHLLIALPPVVLLAAASWAWSSSYTHLASSPSGGLKETEHATTTAERFLRWTSFALLACAALAIRFAFVRAASTRMERTIRVLDVAVDVLLAHPHIFMLAFALLTAFITLSVPFLLLTAKLLLHGYISQPATASAGPYSFLVPSSWARLAAMHTAFVFFWTLAILRGLLRMTVAGATGEWWFYRHRPLSKSLLSVSTAEVTGRPSYSPKRAKHAVKQAFDRARGPSLGTICVSALLLSTFTALSLCLTFLNTLITQLRRRSYSAIPSLVLRILLNGVLLPFVAILGGILKNVNDFALVHAGITGDRFSDSMTEAQQLIAGRNGTDVIIARKALSLRFASPVLMTSLRRYGPQESAQPLCNRLCGSRRHRRLPGQCVLAGFG